MKILENVLEQIPKDNITVKFLSNNTVKVLWENNLSTRSKVITFNDFIESISAAKEEVQIIESIDSPLLPVTKNIGTLQHRKLANGSEIVVLVRDPIPCDINYFGTVYKKCGMPKMIFAIKIFKSSIQSVHVITTKDYIVSENSLLYFYPFSNASSVSEGRICFGMNKISQLDIKSTVMLHSIPDMFLSMENNNDAYGQNLSGLEYRPLLEKIQKKPFNSKWLKPAEMDYKTWINKLG